MEKRIFRKNDIIFRQGDPAECLYCIVNGTVDIWLNYKEPRAKKLNTLRVDTYFGEMALLDDAPRSATAVAAEDGTCLKIYPKSAFNDMLASEGKDFRQLLAQMTDNLVRLTDNYMDVCRTIAAYQTAEEAGKEAAQEVKDSLRSYADMASGFDADADMDESYWTGIDRDMENIWEHEALRYADMSGWSGIDTMFPRL